MFTHTTAMTYKTVMCIGETKSCIQLVVRNNERTTPYLHDMNTQK